MIGQFFSTSTCYSGTRPWKIYEHIALGWVVFLAGTLLYCATYAVLFDHGSLSQRLHGAVVCVTKDWMIWVVLTPFILNSFSNLVANPDAKSGLQQTFSILLSFVIVAMSARLTIEILFGSESLLKTFLLYTPRYVIINVLMSACFLYLLRAPSTEAEEKFQSQFSVAKGDHKHLLDAKDVLYVKSDGNYLEFHTSSHTYLSRQTLKGFLDNVDPACFLRIHRSVVVNQTHIDAVNFNKKEVVLMNAERIKIGRSYQSNLEHFH